MNQFEFRVSVDANLEMLWRQEVPEKEETERIKLVSWEKDEQ